MLVRVSFIFALPIVDVRHPGEELDVLEAAS